MFIFANIQKFLAYKILLDCFYLAYKILSGRFYLTYKIFFDILQQSDYDTNEKSLTPHGVEAFLVKSINNDIHSLTTFLSPHLNTNTTNLRIYSNLIYYFPSFLTLYFLTHYFRSVLKGTIGRPRVFAMLHTQKSWKQYRTAVGFFIPFALTIN